MAEPAGNEVVRDVGAEAGPAQGANDGAPIPVLAAVMRRGDRYLLALRPQSKRHGGLWEFPGGKLLRGESWLDAARRELAEELGVEALSAGEPRLEVHDPGSRFVVAFVDVEAAGEPRAIEHDELRWATSEEMAAMPLAPADRIFVDRLRRSA